MAPPSDSVLERLALSPAQGAEQEQELLQALLTKYADHRGTGEDAKWTVILREYNSRASDQKTEASLKRAAKKVNEHARLVEDNLEKFSKTPAQGADEENELMGALLQKYAEHRGTGEDAKWTVITREFNARACEASQKSEASIKRMAKKSSEKPQGSAQTTEQAAQPRLEAKSKAKGKAKNGDAPEENALLRRNGYVFENASDESLSFRFYLGNTQEYDGPVGTLPADGKISLEFLTSDELEQQLTGKEIAITDTIMVRCFLFTMRMRLKTSDWHFDEKLLGACCDKWAKEDELSEEGLAAAGALELHVWSQSCAAESSPPSAKWEIKVCRCEKPADESGKLRWGAKFSQVRK
jgi:hypothetical protein